MMALIDDFVTFLRQKGYTAEQRYAPILNLLVEFLRQNDLVASQRDAIYLTQQAYQRFIGRSLSSREKTNIVSSVKRAINKFKTDPDNPIYPRDTTRFSYKGLTVVLRARQPIPRVNHVLFFEHDGLMANFEHFTALNAGWGFITNGGSPTGKTFVELQRAVEEFGADIYLFFDLDYYGIVNVINPLFTRTRAFPALNIEPFRVHNLWNDILSNPHAAVLNAPQTDDPVSRPASFQKVAGTMEILFPDQTPTERLQMFNALAQGQSIKAVDYIFEVKAEIEGLLDIERRRPLTLEEVRRLIRTRGTTEEGGEEW